MRILFVVWEEHLSLIFPSQVLMPARALQERGHEVHLLFFTSMRRTRDARRREDELVAACREWCAGVTLRVHWPRALAMPHARRVLAAHLRRLRPDVVHARGPTATVLATSLRRPRPSVVFDVRGASAPEWRMTGGYRTPPLSGAALERVVGAADELEARASRAADGHLAVTEKLRAYLEERHGVDLSASGVVPCCIDTAQFAFDPKRRRAKRQELGLDAGVTVWLYAGSRAAWQELGPGMEALAAALAADPDARAFLLSSDPAELQAQALEHGLPADRIVATRAPHDEMPDWLAAADVGLMLRRRSEVNAVASPVKLTEYAVAGLPMLLSEGIGDASAWAFELGNGHRVPELEKVREAATALAARMPATDEERATWSVAAAERYAWSSHLDTLERVYHSALERSSRAPSGAPT